MANIFYDELIANLADIQSIEHNISEKAQEICTRRQNYADYLEGQLVELKRYQTGVNSALCDLLSSSSSIEGIDMKPLLVSAMLLRKN